VRIHCNSKLLSLKPNLEFILPIILNRLSRWNLGLDLNSKYIKLLLWILFQLRNLKRLLELETIGNSSSFQLKSIRLYQLRRRQTFKLMMMQYQQQSNLMEQCYKLKQRSKSEINLLHLMELRKCKCINWMLHSLHRNKTVNTLSCLGNILSGKLGNKWQRMKQGL
jgi:hypothetical protein